MYNPILIEDLSYTHKYGILLKSSSKHILIAGSKNSSLWKFKKMYKFKSFITII